MSISSPNSIAPMPGPTPAEPSVRNRSITRRELETLALTELGMTNFEIAQQMYIAEATVKKHQASILRKLEARNRTAAVVKARQLGLLH